MLDGCGSPWKVNESKESKAKEPVPGPKAVVVQHLPEAGAAAAAPPPPPPAADEAVVEGGDQPGTNQNSVDIGTSAEVVDVSDGESSSSDSNAPMEGPPTPRAEAPDASLMEDDSSRKRPREDSDGEDEMERTRAAALLVGALDCSVPEVRREAVQKLVAGLSSPHEESSYLDQAITDEERREAHMREFHQLEDFEVFEEIDYDDITPGTKVITTTWVDRRKGPNEVKGRICCREYNDGSVRTDTFASTPGAFSIRLIDLIAMTHGFMCVVADVSAAFLHTDVPEGKEIIVAPPHDYVPKNTNLKRCHWRLRKMLYGLRGAPAAWQAHLSELLQSMGFRRGTFEASMFYHPEWKVYVLVHVDDIHMTGEAGMMQHVLDELQTTLLMKVNGPFRPGMEYGFLRSRRVVDKRGVVMIPDDSYIMETARQLNMVEARPAATPAATLKPQEDDQEPLDQVTWTLYRSAVGRLLYLSYWRVDIQWTVRLLSTRVQGPVNYDLRVLRHLVRYLLGTRDMGLRFERNQKPIKCVDVFVDSDWAGSQSSRKSTSGGIIMVNGCCMQSWSRGQTVVAQSSCEAEFFAIVLGTSEGLAAKETLMELGMDVTVRIHSDSSAGRSQCFRLGAGALKHVETRFFHIQQLVNSRRVEIIKVAGEENIADLATKGVTKRVLDTLLPNTGLVRTGASAQRIAACSVGKSLNSNLEFLLCSLITLLQTKQTAAHEGASHSDGEIPYFIIFVCVSAISLWLLIGYYIVRFIIRGNQCIGTLKVSIGTMTDGSIVPGASLSNTDAELLNCVSTHKIDYEKFWVSKTGDKYHRIKHCGGLSNAGAGLREVDPCLRCVVLREQNNEVRHRGGRSQSSALERQQTSLR